jgi:hypothetical protein
VDTGPEIACMTKHCGWEANVWTCHMKHLPCLTGVEVTLLHLTALVAMAVIVRGSGCKSVNLSYASSLLGAMNRHASF